MEPRPEGLLGFRHGTIEASTDFATHEKCEQRLALLVAIVYCAKVGQHGLRQC